MVDKQKSLNNSEYHGHIRNGDYWGIHGVSSRGDVMRGVFLLEGCAIAGVGFTTDFHSICHHIIKISLRTCYLHTYVGMSLHCTTVHICSYAAITSIKCPVPPWNECPLELCVVIENKSD